MNKLLFFWYLMNWAHFDTFDLKRGSLIVYLREMGFEF